MEAIKTVKANNKVLNIFYDQNTDSPRNWDNLSKMIFFGRNAQHLGDKHDMQLSGDYNGDRFVFIEKGEVEVRKHFKDVAICKAVHIYDHSGISISTSMGYPFDCKWDSGTIGFVIVTKADIRKAYEVKRITKDILNRADKVLESEIEVLNQYLIGDVYGFKLEENGEEVDSCWGFYGTDFIHNGLADYLDEELKEQLKQA